MSIRWLMNLFWAAALGLLIFYAGPLTGIIIWVGLYIALEVVFTIVEFFTPSDLSETKSDAEASS